MSRALSPEVQATLRAATISEDGLTLTLAGELDRKLYQATAKAIEALGGKWNRRAQAHLFTSDVRDLLAGVLDGDALPKKNPLAFFATPEPLVVLMLNLLGDVRGQRVLEPSAGDGHIADALLEAGALVDVIELDDTRHGHLIGAGYQPVARDFLAFTPSERYPVIVMNPPFTAEGDAQAYITHIEHAWANCLAPGGTLVAIAPSGFTFREDRRAQAFRALVEEHGEYSPNAQNAFVESGTGVQTVTLYIRKPAPPQEVAMLVPTEQAAKNARKSSKQAAVAESKKQPQVFTEYMPGDFVICEIGGQPINSGITGLHVGTPLRLDVVNRNGPSTIPQNAITCRDDYSPVAPVRVGDLVTLRFRQGELFKVVEPAGADGVVELENIAAPQDRPSSPLSGLRVTRRVNIADLYADLSLPLPSYLQEAASNGVVVEPEVAPDQPVPAEWLAQLEEWRTRFHIGARVRFPAASSTEPGAVEEFVGVVVSHEPGISEHCTVDEDGHSTVVKFRNLALEAAPTEEPALASDPAPASATPDLQAPRLTPGAIGLLLVPLSQTVRSSCNVRNHYDPQAVEELAASLAAEGQIENCTGRWNAEGQVEIVAGETRRRAQLLRVERGEIGDAYPLMVHIREMTDAEALAVSATENMRRRSMTALEECEAMQRLNDAGRSVEEIASMFGFKSLQPVHDRILVARNLHTAAREALDKGNISFAQAAVIARAPGQHLQESLLQAATSWNPTSAKGLAEMLTRGQFLVANAKFDVEASGLEIRRDLFDAFAPYFEDKAKALDAQIAWAHARAQEIEKDGGQAFVHVVTGENGNFYTSDHRAYEYVGPNDPAAGTIVYVSTLFGTSREERAKLRSNAQATTTEDGGTKVETVRPMRDSAYLEAHKLRATAARAAVLGDQHLTLALTVWGLIIGSTNDVVRVNLQPVSAAHEIPELKVRAEALANLLAPDTDSGSVYISALGASGVRPDPERVLRRLVAMSDDELLGHLNTLASLTAYDWFQYGNKTPAKPEYAYLASLTDAPQRLAASFRLTDEWLKRYPRHELLALADEAGLGRALIEDCGTLKEMRARLLEHADRLHAEGFVPALVRFPEPPATADATATAAD